MQKDFEVVVKDAKELIEAASGDANAKTKAALAKLEESLENAKHKFEVMEGKGEEAVRRGSEIIGDYPYQAVGISMAFGVLIGMLFKRK